MTRIDNHSHILLANIVEMVSAAKAKKLREYSITEHVSQFRELRESIRFGSVHSTGRMFNDLREYTNEFRKVDGHRDSGMKINLGLEVDYSARFEKEVGDFVRQEEWDILLCSVHEFDDGTDIERALRVVDPVLAHNRWREYLKLETMALESDFVPFDVLSHPVRMGRGNVNPPLETDDLLLDLARTARRRTKALELNGNDIEYAPQLVRTLAHACSKAGCRVSLGSDAHHPKDVFRNMEAALSLVQEFKLEIFARTATP
jgi:histidinol-phosphatase (PHP family)